MSSSRRRSRARLQALTATLVVALAGLLVPVSPAAAADEVHQLPWSPDIFAIADDGSRRHLDFAQWQRMGAPAPTAVPVDYVKAPWSDTVYGVAHWPRSPQPQVSGLTWTQFQAAQPPAVAIRAEVPGTTYHRWRSDPREIFAVTPDGRRHKLTFDEWRRAGAPGARTIDRGYYRAPWSSDIHEVRADGTVRRVGFAEWTALGAPTPAITPVDYVRTPWSPTVYGLVTWPRSADDRRVGHVSALSWSQFLAAGAPAVRTSPRIPGDAFVVFPQQDTVFHSVRGQLTPLTYPDWRDAGFPSPSRVPAPSPAYIRGILVVNKSLPLPATYGAGLTRETASAFSRMADAAAESGLWLYISSGYRSYASQRAIYQRFVAAEGSAGADRHSARPGHSEHQTGLAIDLNTVSASFASTPEGRWVRDNAHRFGFIVRYPQGKEHITGYIYEPWHLRFVGADAAGHLYRTGLTLEEYLGVSSRY